MPALNEARIALICPRVNGTSAISTCRRLAVGGNRFVVNSDGRKADGVVSVLTRRGNRPRRFASSNVASKSSSNSPSLNCVIACRRFLGRMCRCDAASVASFAASTVGDDGMAAFTPSVERRPGIAGSAGSRRMTQSWRGQRMSAIAILQRPPTFNSPKCQPPFGQSRQCACSQNRRGSATPDTVVLPGPIHNPRNHQAHNQS
jgi:hypothetical protein